MTDKIVIEGLTETDKELLTRHRESKGQVYADILAKRTSDVGKFAVNVPDLDEAESIAQAVKRLVPALRFRAREVEVNGSKKYYIFFDKAKAKKNDKKNGN